MVRHQVRGARICFAQFAVVVWLVSTCYSQNQRGQAGVAASVAAQDPATGGLDLENIRISPFLNIGHRARHVFAQGLPGRVFELSTGRADHTRHSHRQVLGEGEPYFGEQDLKSGAADITKLGLGQARKWDSRRRAAERPDGGDEARSISSAAASTPADAGDDGASDDDASTSDDEDFANVMARAGAHQGARPQRRDGGADKAARGAPDNDDATPPGAAPEAADSSANVDAGQAVAAAVTGTDDGEGGDADVPQHGAAERRPLEPSHGLSSALRRAAGTPEVMAAQARGRVGDDLAHDDADGGRASRWTDASVGVALVQDAPQGRLPSGELDPPIGRSGSSGSTPANRDGAARAGGAVGLREAVGEAGGGAASAAVSRVCEPGSTRSFGRVAAVSADLASPGSMLAALRARGCDGEVIVMGVGAAKREMEIALNSLLQLHALGMQHYLLAAPTAEACRQYSEALDSAGCVWTDIATVAGGKDVDTVAGKAIAKWLAATKAVQLGYNALVLSDDTFMVANWYEFVRSGRFDSPQVIVPSGAGGFLSGDGMAYLRGATPGSAPNPALLVAFDVLTRLLAYARGFKDSPSPPPTPSAVVSDAVCSALAGRALSVHAASPSGAQSLESLSKAVQAGCRAMLAHSKQPVAPAWAELASSTFSNATHMEIVQGRLQALSAPFRLEQGGDWLERAQLSTSGSPGLLSFVVQDGGALWPHGSDTQATPSPEISTLLIAPSWLMSTWAEGGQKGWWERASQYGPPSASLAPRVVLAQAAGLPDTAAAAAVFKLVGWWHPQASALAVGHATFLASSDADPLPKLLMLLPSAMLWPMQQHDLWALYAELARVAALAGRVPVWPGFDCTVTWTQRTPSIAEADPWMQRATKHYPADGVRHGVAASDIFAFGNVTERFLELRCLPLAMLTHGCLSHGLSLGDWLQSGEALSAKDRTPSAANTLQWPWVGSLLRADQTMWVHGPSDMAAGELLAALDEVSEQRVVFLPKLFRPKGVLPPSSQSALSKLAELSRACPVLEAAIAQLSI